MAKPGRDKASNKDVVITFRLSEDEFAPFDALLKRSTLKRSAFFRQTFLSADKQVTLKEKFHPDYTKLLFFVNKASNNLNQIAKRLNGAEKVGLIDSKSYYEALNHLISIDQMLKGALDAVQS
jgi:hypothetical protein